MKKLISILLSALMLAGVIALPVSAAETSAVSTAEKVKDVELDGVNYSLYDDGHAVIASYTGHETDLTIPESVEDYTVTMVGTLAFDDDWDVKTLRLPDTITNLGWRSIGECAITSLYLGSAIKEISQEAFEYNTHLTDIYYNGTEADWKKIEISEDGNERLSEVTMHYVQEVNTFDVTGVIEPIAGQKANFNAYDTNTYSVESFTWYDVTDGYTVNDTMKFEKGHTYRAEITLYARWGCRFIYDDVSAKINGEDATYSSVPGVGTYNAIKIKKNFVCNEAGVITNVEITDVVEPAIGESPSYEFKVLTEGVTVESVKWSYSDELKDGTTNMESGEKFEAGKAYSIYFKLSADEGYKFDVDSNGINTYTATVNGKKTAVYTTNNSTSEKESAIKYFFPELTENTTEPEVIKIDEIKISNLYVPRVGKTLPQTADADGHYTIESINWYDYYAGKWLDSSDIVEKDKQYEVNIHVRAAEGYKFADYETITATINDSPANEITSVVEEDHSKVLNIRTTYPAFDNVLTKVYEIEVTGVTIPVDGEAVVKSADDGLYFSINNVSWYDVSANRWMQEGDKFEAGKDYEVNVNVRAKDGCEFDTPIINIIATINGFDATAGKMDFEEINEYLNIRCTFTCAEKSVDPTETAEPQKPTETAEPTTPSETAEPQKPTETAEPTTPSETAEPQKPTETAETPTETVEPQKPTETAEPTTPTEATEPEKYDISTWVVTGIKNKTYTGKAIKQSVQVKDEKGDAADFEVYYTNNINVGTATMKIVGIGEFKGSITKTFKITKAAQPMKVTKATKSIKANKLKSKKQTAKSLKITKAQGKVTVKIVKKGTTAKIYKKLKVSSKGVITFKKGSYKKSTYKVKLRITAKGTKNYKKGTKTVTVKVKVK